MSKKIKLTDHLIFKACSVFRVNDMIYTGEGLSRQELRKLKNKGFVVSRHSSGMSNKLGWRATEALWNKEKSLSV